MERRLAEARAASARECRTVQHASSRADEVAASWDQPLHAYAPLAASREELRRPLSSGRVQSMTRSTTAGGLDSSLAQDALSRSILRDGTQFDSVGASSAAEGAGRAVSSSQEWKRSSSHSRLDASAGQAAAGTGSLWDVSAVPPASSPWGQDASPQPHSSQGVADRLMQLAAGMTGITEPPPWEAAASAAATARALAAEEGGSARHSMDRGYRPPPSLSSQLRSGDAEEPALADVRRRVYRASFAAKLADLVPAQDSGRSGLY